MAVNAEGILELLDNVDQKHEDAHKRLRADFRTLEERVNDATAVLNEAHLANKSKIAELANTPLDATKLVLSPKIVVSIVIGVVSICAGVWAANAGLRSDVRDILTRMDAQKAAIEASLKLQEVQSQALKTSVDEMRRRQELQQFEIQGLKETILKQQQGR